MNKKFSPQHSLGYIQKLTQWIFLWPGQYTIIYYLQWKRPFLQKVYKKILLHFWWEGNLFYRYLIIQRCFCQSNWVFVIEIDANYSKLLVMDFRATLHSTNISRVSLSFFCWSVYWVFCPRIGLCSNHILCTYIVQGPKR